MAALAGAWKQSGLATLLMRAPVCNATAAAVRFQAYAALLFGAKGIVQVGCGTGRAAAENHPTVASVNTDLVYWGDQLLGLRTASVHSTAPFAVPGVMPLPANSTSGTVHGR